MDNLNVISSTILPYVQFSTAMADGILLILIKTQICNI